MIRILRKATIIMALQLANSAWALPTLQLDVVNGDYDTTEESTVATSTVFVLRALLNDVLNINSPYYISVAIAPGQSQSSPTPNFGTFKIGSTTYGSAALAYGTPPLSSLFPNIPTHSIFPSYYLQLPAFTFSSTDTVAAYNVQDDSSAQGSLYYKDFTVDVSNLLPAYSLHFDLYNTVVEQASRGQNTRTIYDTDFAPFSHDASSGHQSVPDASATLILLGLGLAGMAIARRTSAHNA